MNPREILGVANDATPEQIKSAYRKLAMKHHPDRNGDSDESKAKFQQIQEAYSALTKPQSSQNNRSNPFGDENPFARHGFAWAFNQEDFWANQKPANVDYNVRAAIPLEKAYTGTQLSVTINDRIVTVDVPAGAFNGMRLTVVGEGSTDHKDLPPGNLYIIIMVQPHSVFQCSGHDLYKMEGVDVLDLITGCEIEVETISGDKINVTIPEGSSPRTRLRVAGKGMPNGQNGFGSLFIHLDPVFPPMSKDQIDKLRDLKKD